MTAAKLRLAMAAMGKPETKVGELCLELGVTRQTLYRHIGPDGSLREDGSKIIKLKNNYTLIIHLLLNTEAGYNCFKLLIGGI
jgi:hypothetical protein